MRRITAVLLVVLGGSPLFAQSIFTYAGGGSVDGRPATVAALHQIDEIAIDSRGNLYVADTINHRIRKVMLSTGVISTVAGTGAQGYSGDGGEARTATFFEPNDVAVDAIGNLYIADSRNFRIRHVDFGTGIISTVAGMGQFGFSGDGGPATTARISLTESIAVGPSGDLYISDGSNRIRKVSAASRIITTFAGGRTGFDGDGGPATAAAFERPRGMAVGPDGSLYVADYGNHRIRRIDRTGVITTVVGTGANTSSGDGGAAILASINAPHSVDFDAEGNLFIVEGNGLRVRKVSASTGSISTVAGALQGKPDDGIPATEARLTIEGSAISSSGDLYVIDRAAAAFSNADSRIRKIDRTTGIISTIAGVTYTGFVFTGDGGPATAAVLVFQGVSELDSGGLAVDQQGNLHIADHGAGRIRKVARESGQIATIATPNAPGAMAFDGQGNLFVAEFDRIQRIDPRTGSMARYAGGNGPSQTGDGGPATRAGTGRVNGLAVDSAGNLYLGAGTRLRKITASTGIINTIAGGASSGFSGDGGPATAAVFSHIRSVAIDSQGNLYVGDAGNNHRIRKIDAASGIITTVVGDGRFAFAGDGGPATLASIDRPNAIAFDSAGNLFFTDSTNKVVRKVDSRTKIITTVAGTGQFIVFGDYSGDNGPATRARFSNPYGIAVDADGNVFVSDTESNRVRAVYACVPVASPILTSPANGSSGVGSFPRLTWRAVKGAFRYDVLLDTVNPPKTVVAANIATTTFSPANLDSLTTYYWQVIAKGDPYCTPPSSANSEIRSFTTSAECAPPSQP